MNKEEHIQVITDIKELYDKCENMEQLFDKYYLPLLDKHYSKTYKLQQENKQLKDNWNKLKDFVSETKIKEFEKAFDKRYGKVFTQVEIIVCNMILDIMQELEKGDSNE